MSSRELSWHSWKLVSQRHFEEVNLWVHSDGFIQFSLESNGEKANQQMDGKSDKNFGWHSDWLMFVEWLKILRFYCPGVITKCAAADGLSNEFNVCPRRVFCQRIRFHAKFCHEKCVRECDTSIYKLITQCAIEASIKKVWNVEAPWLLQPSFCTFIIWVCYGFNLQSLKIFQCK